MAISLPFFGAGGLKTGKARVTPPTGPRPWKPAEVKALRAMAEKRLPIRAMTLKLGRPEAAIRTKLHEEGLAAQPGTATPPASGIPSLS